MSVVTVGMRDATSDERARSQKRRRLPEQSRRNDDPSALSRLMRGSTNSELRMHPAS